MSFATLDLSLFKNGHDTDRQRFGSQLLNGLTQHGFVKLVGHGISDHTVEKLFEWVEPWLHLLFYLVVVDGMSAEQIFLPAADRRQIVDSTSRRI